MSNGTNLTLTELVSRFRALSSAVVYDILDKLGHSNQAVWSGVRPLDARSVVVGPAFTIEGGDFDQNRKPEISSFEMYRRITAGSVIVMASGGHAVSAPWGENSSISARMHGAVGMVTDAGTRDAAPIIELGFPVFSSYVSPVFSSGRFQMFACGNPVELRGQVEPRLTVETGDYVIGDMDGVVIVPRSVIAEVLEAAEHLERVENRIRDQLLAGGDREKVYRENPKFDHLPKR